MSWLGKPFHILSWKNYRLFRGWEMDESIEVGTHRETFEEAGVLGILGPKLTDVEYETRKGKKRRLELESLAKMKHGILLRSGSSHDSSRSSSFMSEYEPAISPVEPVSKSTGNDTKDTDDVRLSLSSTLVQEFVPSLPESKPTIGTRKAIVDDTTSSSPDVDGDSGKSCTFVRMSMFIMYVSEVKDEWPESGRSRKVVDIDTAIEAMSKRPEFHTVLLEVKRNCYHLNIPPQDAVKSVGSGAHI